jgi:hypothetical protein
VTRCVRRGEKAIWIMVPYKQRFEDPGTGEEGYRVTGFGLGNMFDVSQTEGQLLPEPPPVQPEFGETDAARRAERRLSLWLLGQSVQLEKGYTYPSRGYYVPGIPTIRLNEFLPDNDGKAKTLCHAATHHVAAHTTGWDSKADAEVVAESAAFVTLYHFGVDTGAYSLGYVAQWAGEREVFKRNREGIPRVSNTLISAIEGERPDREEEWL